MWGTTTIYPRWITCHTLTHSSCRRDDCIKPTVINRLSPGTSVHDSGHCLHCVLFTFLSSYIHSVEIRHVHQHANTHSVVLQKTPYLSGCQCPIVFQVWKPGEREHQHLQTHTGFSITHNGHTDGTNTDHAMTIEARAAHISQPWGISVFVCWEGVCGNTTDSR